MLVPAEEKASLTGERVKAIWLIHLTIFIFIAQSDKLIWDLTNGGAVTQTCWDMLTNDRREASQSDKICQTNSTINKE